MRTRFPMCWLAGLYLAVLFSAASVEAQYGWNNGSGGSWTDPGNWSPTGGPPNSPADTATINLFSFMTVNLPATLEIDTFNFDSPFCNLTGGTLILDSGFNWNSGELLGPVLVECNGDSEFTGDSAHVGKTLNNGVFVNGGTVNWSSSGDISFNTGSSITNNGTFNCLGTGNMGNSAGLNYFYNGSNGTLVAQQFSANGVLVLAINDGSIQVEGNSSLTFRNSFISDGPISVSSSGSLVFQTSPQVSINSGSTVSGPGFVTMNNSPTTVAGTFTAGLNLAGGTVNFNGPGLDDLAACNITNGTLGGSNQVIVSGPLNWFGGTIATASNAVANGGLNLFGTSLSLSGGRLINTGTALWTNAPYSSTLSFANGASFSNAPGATFTCGLNGMLVNNSVPASQFNNAGDFVMLGGGTTSIYVVFNNSSNVYLESGVFSLNSGGTNSGTFNVNSNATLKINGGTEWFNPGSFIVGPGLVSVTGGTMNLAGGLLGNAVNVAGGTLNWLGTDAAVPSALTLSSGTMGGSNLVTVPGPMTWSGGTLNETGVVVAAGGLTLGNGNNTLTMNDTTLICGSNVIWNGAGAMIIGGGSVLSNSVGVVFDCQNDAGFVNGSGTNLFVNAGLCRKTSGTASTTIGVPFLNTGTTVVQAATLALNNIATNTGLITVLSNATLALTGGTQSSAPGSTLDGGGLVSVLGSTFNLAGDLVSNTVNIASGALNCLGVGNLNPYGLTLSGGTLGGSNRMTVNGPVSILGGTLSDSGGLVADGPMTLGSGSTTVNFNGATLINNSNAIWTGASSAAIHFTSSLLQNAVGAQLDFLADTTMVDFAGSNSFVNDGLCRKTGGTASTTLNVPFYNRGTTIVQVATLALNNIATNTGRVTILSNATLALASGIQSCMPGSTVDGGGLVSVLGSTFNLAGDLVSNTVNIASGALNCLGVGNLNPYGFTLSGGILGGSNRMTVNGPVNILGGTLSDSGGLVANGPMTLGSGSTTVNFNGATLINNSNATWTGASSAAIHFTSSVISNAVGAELDCLADLTMSDLAGLNNFANDGLFLKKGGTGSTTINVPFSNRGTTFVQKATLTLNNTVTCIGTMIVSNVATLALAGGSQSYLPGSVVTGGGNVSVTAGTADFSGIFTSNILSLVFGSTVNFNGTNIAAPAALNITNGTLGGSNFVTVTGPMTWLAGTINGSNAIIANGGLNIGAGATGVTLTGRTLVNGAIGKWVGNTLSLGTSAVFSNAANGTFDCTFDGTILDNASGSNMVANAGLFRKTAGSNSTVINTRFDNFGSVEIDSGTLNFLGQSYIQSAGTTSLKGGNIANSMPLQLLGGTLQGSGLISGSVSNSGIVDPGASGVQGRMIVSGAYAQTATGALNLEISGAIPGNGFSVLTVSNTATLGGDLNLTLTNGYFPPTNATFTFLTCGNRSGVFNNFHYPSNNYVMELLYTSTNVSVHVVGIPAPPSLISSLQFGFPGSGSNTLGFSGVSGYPYSVQYATNLMGPWIDFSTNTAGTNGRWSVIDPDATNAIRFYRGRSL